MKTSVAHIKSEENLKKFLRSAFLDRFSSCKTIAVKLHMGEPGNAYHIRPELARSVCEELKRIGCEPFLFDTPVVYRSPRDSIEGYSKSAAANGFSESSIGFPVVISDEGTEVEGSISTYELARTPLEADGVVLLTHVKGHIACGMGGAIKNVGMGCMTKKTKGMIHSGGEPIYKSGCIQCGECVAQCPTENIRLDEERPHFDRTWCSGCSNCVVVCPDGCIEPRIDLFDRLLAEAAVLAHERFRKVYAINALVNISRLCDCIAESGPIIAPDIGFVCGEDMLSVDVASLELIERVSGKKDLFAEHNIRSPWDHLRAAAGFMKRSLDVVVDEIAL